MDKKLILSSKSPRRREILNLIGMDFIVDESNEFIEYDGTKITDPKRLVAKNALGKAMEIAKKHKNGVVLGVDTVVFIKKTILGKPKDIKDAFKMLKLLQNKTHTVWTGICLIDAFTGKKIEKQEATKVTFSKMTDKEIKEYVKTLEPMDKAGAYAVQGIGSKFIKKIDGDFFNVMGLSANRVYELFKILTSK